MAMMCVAMVMITSIVAIGRECCYMKMILPVAAVSNLVIYISTKPTIQINLFKFVEIHSYYTCKLVRF